MMPHRMPGLMPGAIAYLDAMVKHPGNTVRLHVSVLDPSQRYAARLVRLSGGPVDAGGSLHREEPVPCAIDGTHAGTTQRTACGSYGVVRDVPDMRGVEFAIDVWPGVVGGREQALMACGRVRLVLDAAGSVSLVVGDRAIATGAPLLRRRWYHVTARYDAASGRAWVASTPRPGLHVEARARGEAVVARDVVAGGMLLFAAAQADDGSIVAHFDGKLEAPRVTADGCALAWDFSADIGTRMLTEVSGRALHGETVNAPKRAVTGVRWNGSVHDWRADPAHYAAIHFHSDDLHDANWSVSHEFRLPDNLRTGFYAFRLDAGGLPFHVGFVVTPSPGRGTARLAVLASTLTWLAYANQRGRMRPGGFDNGLGRLPTIDLTDMLLGGHPELGASTYDVHPDGSGVGHASCHRPLFNMRPTGRYWNFAMDLSLIEWLDALGIEYDVIADHDLHEHGAAVLAPYRTVITGSHPEYFTLEMLDALEGFIAGAGRLIYAGGNGFYWRVTFDRAYPGMIELRRAESGARPWSEEVGQYYHPCGAYGGLWSRVGRPPNRLVGIGFVAQGFDAARPYARTTASHDARVAFLFDGLEGPLIGEQGQWGDGAAGAEIDAWLPDHGAPPHLLVVARSGGHSPVYQFTSEEFGATQPGLDGTLHPAVRAEMVFFETPGGGAVLAMGSVAFIASLNCNGFRNASSTLLRNAIARFTDPQPFT